MSVIPNLLLRLEALLFQLACLGNIDTHHPLTWPAGWELHLFKHCAYPLALPVGLGRKGCSHDCPPPIGMACGVGMTPWNRGIHTPFGTSCLWGSIPAGVGWYRQLPPLSITVVSYPSWEVRGKVSAYLYRDQVPAPMYLHTFSTCREYNRILLLIVALSTQQ